VTRSLVMPNHIPSGAADIRIGVRLFRCESAMACDGMGEATIYAEKNPLSTRFKRCVSRVPGIIQ
jgi:hypothetical protein